MHDGVGTGKAAETASLGVVLEHHEVVARPIGAHHRRHQPRRGGGVVQRGSEPVEQADQLAARVVHRSAARCRRGVLGLPRGGAVGVGRGQPGRRLRQRGRGRAGRPRRAADRGLRRRRCRRRRAVRCGPASSRSGRARGRCRAARPAREPTAAAAQTGPLVSVLPAPVADCAELSARRAAASSPASSAVLTRSTSARACSRWLRARSAGDR